MEHKGTDKLFTESTLEARVAELEKRIIQLERSLKVSI